MEKIQPEQIREQLRQKGIEVTLEQARNILELLRKFAAIAVSQLLSR